MSAGAPGSQCSLWDLLWPRELGLGGFLRWCCCSLLLCNTCKAALGQGRPGCPQAGQVVPVLSRGWTRLVHWALRGAMICLHLRRQGSKGGGRRSHQLCDEGCSAEPFQKLVVVEIKVDEFLLCWVFPRQNRGRR